ncbi:NADH-quinone oxidoreductase subunit NuoE [Nocardioides sp. ChNu-153]|uniref:NADH-quinone oxidoreductase subunit NuoE n=1 Tax=unclassified Nocardioides TaxID=2615069 RepID=UPI002405193E|nr:MULTISPECIES: NADH-quinone oxidoreductase subunit NuoE [unclassified Nocardioides]MDF9716763.1 NADH-quinone oxidoreductase subunit NuoE [Nocardioides sp. ChNu-99]MDN7121975.1 NADH-quinone oxidoreductase subunit NuoE [Nocardioides sp. ChNu-153]
MTEVTGAGTGPLDAAATSDGTALDASLDATTLGELRQIAARYPQGRSGLLPMLHLVQSAQGRITPAGIEACADVLGLSPAEVSGVATFYTMYKRRSVGDYHVGVCTNTLCAVMGGDEIFATLQDHLGIGNDETTDDGRISLEHVECNAACDYAPVVMVNWEFVDDQTPESAVRLVDDLRSGAEVHSTRGPRICTWREAERVLAGFPDDRADEGPGAGTASLAGLRVARERGWEAPRSDTDARRTDEHADSSEQAAVAADEQADTGRAETETKIEEGKE